MAHHYQSYLVPGLRAATGLYRPAFGAAAEQERDLDRRGKLRAIASFLDETGKDFAAEVVAKVIAHQAGAGLTGNGCGSFRVRAVRL